MTHTIDRDEVYNTLTQIYNDETHDEIIERLDLIEFIFDELINQDIMGLENIQETLQK
jgi:hypothetical protein